MTGDSTTTRSNSSDVTPAAAPISCNDNSAIGYDVISAVNTDPAGEAGRQLPRPLARRHPRTRLHDASPDATTLSQDVPLRAPLCDVSSVAKTARISRNCASGRL